MLNWNKGTEQSSRRGARLLLVGALAVSLAASAFVALRPGEASAATAYRIIQQPLQIDGRSAAVAALNVDSTTYVGVRSLSGELGLNVKFDKATQTVTLTGRGRTLTLDLTSGRTTLDGQTVYGLPAITHKYTTFVPLRFLLERMGYGLSYDSKTKLIAIETIEENDLRVETASIERTGDQLSLTVNYPVISGWSNAEAERKINAFLQDDAMAHAASGMEALEEAARGNAEVEAENPDIDIPPVNYEGAYTVTYNEKGLFSVYTEYYIYTGGAHGLAVRIPYTFDLSTGDRLTLKQAASNNPDYVGIINAEIRSQIKARGIFLLEPFETIEPDRPFYLKHSGIVVFFGQYEYTAYAEGMPEFETPFSKFR